MPSIRALPPVPLILTLDTVFLPRQRDPGPGRDRPYDPVLRCRSRTLPTPASRDRLHLDRGRRRLWPALVKLASRFHRDQLARVWNEHTASGAHRSRRQEFPGWRRLKSWDRPQGLDLHLIADNYATHKHPKVLRWLDRHPRFHIHFIPTSSSWLNLVERFFRDLTDKRIRRGVFKSVPDLITAISDYIDEHNKSPRPFVWKAKAATILEKVRRPRLALDKTPTA